MYSLPSTSQSREPLAFATKNGSPPTLRKARTGEFTPPGMNRLASAKRVELVMCAKTTSIVDGVQSRLRREQPARIPIPELQWVFSWKSVHLAPKKGGPFLGAT